MKRTTKQYSIYLGSREISELREIAFRYGKVKNYVYSRFGSIGGLEFIDYPREIRDVWVKEKFGKQWDLSARYWKMAFEEAFANIKTIWSDTKKSVKKQANKLGLSKDEIHYINYVLKANKILHKILNHLEYEINEKFDSLDQEKLNKLICRLVRENHYKAISKKFKSFMIDSAMYSFTDGSIEIVSLTPRKRLKIKLTDNTVKKGNLRIVIKGERIEIHRANDVKIKENNSDKIVAIDKGYRDLIVTSENNFFGEGLSSLLTPISDKLSAKNKQRNKLHALVKNLDEKGKHKKANKIKKHNLGLKKYDKYKAKSKATVDKFINCSINKFIEKENPKLVIVEDLTWTGQKTEFKRINRLLSSWCKGYLQERLEFKFEQKLIELSVVNPAYTSQICHKCGAFGERKNDKFHCNKCGVVHADYNGSKNVYNRHFDSEISLFTPYKKVKEILLSRLSEGSKKPTVPTKNRDTKVEETVGVS